MVAGALFHSSDESVSNSSDWQGLEFTGERMVPEGADPTTYWEHIYRYRFAATFVKNKRVLDIACGEGYGPAALLGSGARSVIGVDVSLEVCAHARKKYGIDTQVGNAECIPLQKSSIDVIVSFETIEHLLNPERFLDECHRVLSKDGLIIVSTPNIEVYLQGHFHNPFHMHEFSKQRLAELLNARFRKVRLYSQSPISVAWWSIRSLAAERTPWGHIITFRRLRDSIRRRNCPYLWGNVPDKYRLAPIQAIIEKNGFLAYLVNPYLVRRHLSGRMEVPGYLVAVAQV